MRASGIGPKSEGRLMASEARHYGIYWILATTFFDRDLVMHRLEQLSLVESKLLATLHPAPRIHR